MKDDLGECINGKIKSVYGYFWTNKDKFELPIFKYNRK